MTLEESLIAEAQAELARVIEERDRFHKACVAAEYEISNAIGGYLYGYADHTYQDTGETVKDLPLWGDHVAITLAEELVGKAKLKDEQVSQLTSQLTAERATAGRMREALAHMLRWFGGWPEYKPNDEHKDYYLIESGIDKARQVLDQTAR
jgi:hypothetical protein